MASQFDDSSYPAPIPMIDLNTHIERVAKIGPAYQKRLKKLGIQTILDLLYYFPQRYNDFSNIIPINNIKNGSLVCIQGQITEIATEKTFRKWMDITEAVIEDETGSIKALWFNQPYIEKSLKEGDFVCLAGKISLGKGGLYLNNPAHERIGELDENPSNSPRINKNLTPKGGIKLVNSDTKALTSLWLQKIIKQL